tara:strand:+ start:497 stop:1924 length:1428 start_codon:yes stop_codon:yes gene_type:complete
MDERLLESVAKDDIDWSMIEEKVHASLPTHEIFSLERVINPLLTGRFEAQKKKEKSGKRVFGFRASCHKEDEGKDYRSQHLETCSEGHKLSDSPNYGRGIYFAKHAIYPTYFMRGYSTSSVKQQRENVNNGNGSGSIEMIVSELLLGNSFDYRDNLSMSRGEGGVDSNFDRHDSIQGTENSFAYYEPPNYLMSSDVAAKLKSELPEFSPPHHGLAAGRGLQNQRFEASYYAKNPFDIENARQYIFIDPNRCKPSFIVNIRPKAKPQTITMDLNEGILSKMINPENAPQALMFENEIICEINSTRIVISGLNTIGATRSRTCRIIPEFLKSLNLRDDNTNTISLVPPGWEETRVEVALGQQTEEADPSDSAEELDRLREEHAQLLKEVAAAHSVAEPEPEPEPSTPHQRNFCCMRPPSRESERRRRPGTRGGGKRRKTKRRKYTKRRKSSRRKYTKRRKYKKRKYKKRKSYRRRRR